MRVSHQLLEHIMGSAQFIAPQERGRGVEKSEAHCQRLIRRLGLADRLPRNLQCAIRKAAQPQRTVVTDEPPKSIVESEQLRMVRARQPSLQMLPGGRLIAHEMV